MAGVGPADIQFAEVHDCFTIAEIVAIEDLGFVSKGQGGPYTAEGCTALNGDRPVNTSGGLKAKGHPVGATGVAQICDLVLQIRGEAGERQVARHDDRTGAESRRLGRRLAWSPYWRQHDRHRLHRNFDPLRARGVRAATRLTSSSS